MLRTAVSHHPSIIQSQHPQEARNNAAQSTYCSPFRQGRSYLRGVPHTKADKKPDRHWDHRGARHLGSPAALWSERVASFLLDFTWRPGEQEAFQAEQLQGSLSSSDEGRDQRYHYRISWEVWRVYQLILQNLIACLPSLYWSLSNRDQYLPHLNESPPFKINSFRDWPSFP